MGNVTYLEDWKKREMSKFKSRIPIGFNSIEDFLTYCAVRRNPYFKISHANFLYELAGRPELNIRNRSQFVPIYETEMSELLGIISKEINPRQIRK